VQWYNHERNHNGIRFVTSAQRHDGEDRSILTQREAVYKAAKAKSGTLEPGYPQLGLTGGCLLKF